MLLIAGAVIFACAAFLGIALASIVCQNVPLLADGPQLAATQEAHLELPDGSHIDLVDGKALDFFGGTDGNYARPIALIVGAIALGIVLMLRQTQPLQLGLTALLCIPLVAAWYSDWVKGIIPDWFTLGPLVVVAIYVVAYHAWWVGLSAIVPFVPFALAAMLSGGKGMGWGDAKFVALGGAVLGMETAIFAFAVACFLATIVAVIKDRGKSPVIFGPYLISAVAISIAFQVHG